MTRLGLFGAALALLAAVALTACDDHQGEHCTGMSTQLVTKPVVGVNGKMTIALVNEAYCKRWEKDEPR